MTAIRRVEVVRRRASFVLALRASAVLVLCALVVAPPAHPQEAMREVAFKSPIREFVDANERVSGGAVAGVVLYTTGADTRSDDLFVYLPSPVNVGTLRLQSVDGRYYAEIEYDFGTTSAQWLRLKLPESSKTHLAGHDLQSVAALLSSADEQTIYPVQWSQRSSATHVRTYLNTERASAFYLDRAQGRRGACKAPQAASAFKFDQICDVPIDAVTSASGILEIERKAGVRRLEPVVVRVELEPRP